MKYHSYPLPALCWCNNPIPQLVYTRLTVPKSPPSLTSVVTLGFTKLHANSVYTKYYTYTVEDLCKKSTFTSSTQSQHKLALANFEGRLLFSPDLYLSPSFINSLANSAALFNTSPAPPLPSFSRSALSKSLAIPSNISPPSGYPASV